MIGASGRVPKTGDPVGVTCGRGVLDLATFPGDCLWFSIRLRRMKSQPPAGKTVNQIPPPLSGSNPRFEPERGGVFGSFFPGLGGGAKMP